MHTDEVTHEVRVRCSGSNVTWGDLECVYPDYPGVDSLKINEADRPLWMDLRPYVDATAHTINEHTSILRTYRMFRTMGLRHLCVTNKHNHVLGIVTRADLASIHIDDLSSLDKSYSSQMSMSSSHHRLSSHGAQRGVKTYLERTGGTQDNL